MKKQLVNQQVLLVFEKRDPKKLVGRDRLTVTMSYVERVPDVVAVFRHSGYHLVFQETKETFECKTYKTRWK